MPDKARDGRNVALKHRMRFTFAGSKFCRFSIFSYYTFLNLQMLAIDV